MSKVEYVTSEGLKKLRKELEFLETIERAKIAKQISEAREKGDISENYEYDAAKEAQVLVEMRIARLKYKFSNLRLIDSSKIGTEKVSILSKVYVKNMINNLPQILILVPDSEADLNEGKISVNSPIAKGLLGKIVGDTAYINLPGRKKLELKILKIE